MDKIIKEFYIPINPDGEELERYNKTMGTNYTSTDDNFNKTMDSIAEMILTISDNWYFGDSIRIKVEVEYQPEDK